MTKPGSPGAMFQDLHFEPAVLKMGTQRTGKVGRGRAMSLRAHPRGQGSQGQAPISASGPSSTVACAARWSPAPRLLLPVFKTLLSEPTTDSVCRSRATKTGYRNQCPDPTQQEDAP